MTTTFRPPTVPLITVDPYFSIWSTTDRLYDDHTTHWTNHRNGMYAMIVIDDRPYRFMGRTLLSEEEDPIAPMEQREVKVEPLTTTYTFAAGGVVLEAAFTTPLLPDDLDLLSRPVTYLNYRVRSEDGQSHQIKIYTDITAESCVHESEQIVDWHQHHLDEATAVSVSTVEQPVLQRTGDDTRIDWGYLYLVLPHSEAHRLSVQAVTERVTYAQTRCLSAVDTERPRAVQERTPVLAAEMDLGVVQVEWAEAFLLVAYDDKESVIYFQQPLPAYWRREGLGFEELLSLAIKERPSIMERCRIFNETLMQESEQVGGAQLRDILALAYRQAVAAHKLVFDENGQVLFMSKENFSNGCMATVDVSYPSMPLFLKYNPELVKGMMRPIFRYAASDAWTFDFAPHDVGTYPQANGQVYGENKLAYQMPIEECGNMLLMAGAVSHYEGDVSFAAEHWALLTTWADYLLANGLDPANQLCTDDFAGHLAHNANLSIKAIVGLATYARMCEQIQPADSESYRRAAMEMAVAWQEMALADDHYKLTFDSDADSWSLKYNLVWDRLLNLQLFPEEIAERELDHYLKKQNRYGVPLDSRADYTKADWLIWCASMGSRDTLAALIAPFWTFLHETSSRVPITDWYDTKTGKQMNFQNRSVVGGFYLPLLMAELGNDV